MRVQMELEAISDFFKSLRPNSERTYSQALNEFYEFAAPRCIGTASMKDVTGYISSLRERLAPDGLPLADGTIRHKANALRSIGSYLEAARVIHRSPFRILRRVVSSRQRCTKRPTALIPFDKVADLMAAPASNTKDGKLDRALLAILFGGALRRSEAHNLRLKDVRVDAAGIRYLDIPRAKSGKSQRQPLPPWAWEPFARLLAQRVDDGAAPESYVFVFYYADGVAREDIRIEIKTLYNRYVEYCKQIGIAAAPHSARATAATMLAYHGWSERKIADFLRHTSTAQVQVYLKLANDLRENAGLSLEFPGLSLKVPANVDEVLFNGSKLSA